MNRVERKGEETGRREEERRAREEGRAPAIGGVLREEWRGRREEAAAVAMGGKDDDVIEECRDVRRVQEEQVSEINSG